MVPSKYQLEEVGRFLVAAFERRRPGITAWTPELERELLAEAESELVQMERQCREMGIDDATYWKKVRGALQSILLPRYAALAKEEMALARSGYHLWRNGDIVARIAFAGAGLVLGAAAVAIPWIPITEKWVPWALFVGGPLIPDAQMWFYRKRYERRLNTLVADLGRAGKSLDEYRSIAELQQILGEQRTIEAAPLDVAALSTPPAAAEADKPAPEAQVPPSRLKH